MNLGDYYSTDYFAARKRFVAASARLGFRHESLEISAPSPTAEALSIDVAVAGAADPATVLVVSSGIHGVEGPFGSAVQLAFLDSLPDKWQPPEGAAVVLLHALNPFGFAWRRRFNEENVDLNRNFLLADEAYAGSPPMAARFRNVLTPAGVHRRFGFWTARMALLALRHGTGSFWRTLPVGQYDYPDWLFYGGRDRTQTAAHLDRLLPRLIQKAGEVVHLDFHTGLGRWAQCQLLLSDAEPDENLAWWSDHFDDTVVRKSIHAPSSYAIRGGFGQWLQARFDDRIYRYAVAEFGTYSPRRVIQALAEEMRWYARPDLQSRDRRESGEHWSRQKLANVFVPRDSQWRTQTLAKGLSLVNRAANTLWPQAAAGSS